MEVEHLQWRYQHLIGHQSPNQPDKTISQCNKKFDITKGNEVIESNIQNPELNKDAPPLNIGLSCEEQLIEISKKYHYKYITFPNNKQIFPDHPFPKVTCLIVGDSILAGIDENQLKSGKRKVKVRYLLGAGTKDIYNYIKPLL